MNIRLEDLSGKEFARFDLPETMFEQLKAVASARGLDVETIIKEATRAKLDLLEREGAEAASEARGGDSAAGSRSAIPVDAGDARDRLHHEVALAFLLLNTMREFLSGDCQLSGRMRERLVESCEITGIESAKRVVELEENCGGLLKDVGVDTSGTSPMGEALGRLRLVGYKAQSLIDTVLPMLRRPKAARDKDHAAVTGTGKRRRRRSRVEELKRVKRPARSDLAGPFFGQDAGRLRLARPAMFVPRSGRLGRASRVNCEQGMASVRAGQAFVIAFVGAVAPRRCRNGVAAPWPGGRGGSCWMGPGPVCAKPKGRKMGV